MLSSGARARYGLPSPSAKLIEEGDPITMAYCVWGALTARAGFFVKDENGLPAEIRDYVSRLAAPYFSAAVAWYEALEIGAPAKDLYHAVHRRIGEPFFGLALNPGHYIHLEEWLRQ